MMNFCKKNKFQGRYYSKVEMKEVFRNEYIFPSKFYSKENFLKISDSNDYMNNAEYDPDSYSSGWFF